MTTYYRLYDKQCGIYMHTGYNAEGQTELIKQYLEYINPDIEDEDENVFFAADEQHMIEMIEDNEFIIEKSDEPFEEQSDDDVFMYI